MLVLYRLDTCYVTATLVFEADLHKPSLSHVCHAKLSRSLKAHSASSHKTVEVNINIKLMHFQHCGEH